MDQSELVKQLSDICADSLVTVDFLMKHLKMAVDLIINLGSFENYLNSLEEEDRKIFEKWYKSN